MTKYLVTVKPGTSQEKIIETSSTNGSNVLPELTIYLRAKAHDGEADEALVKVLSKYFAVPKTSIKITRGLKSRKKIIEL